MSWNKVLDAILNGSPWGLMLGALWIAWKMRKEYIASLSAKDEIIDSMRIEIKELNRAKLDLVIETTKHCEEMTTAAQQGLSDLHNRRADDAIAMQKETINTMSVLNATLTGLIDAIRSPKQ